MKSCMSLQCAHRDIEKKSNRKSEFGIPDEEGKIVRYLIQMADPIYYGEVQKQPIQGQQCRSLGIKSMASKHHSVYATTPILC